MEMVKMAQYLSPAIRPSVERLPAFCGNGLLGEKSFIRSTQIYLYMGV